jgi:hypothetical protein
MSKKEGSKDKQIPTKIMKRSFYCLSLAALFPPE